MKKLYLLAFIALGCTAADAQIQKGGIMRGGNLGYSDQSQSSGISTSNPYKSTNRNLTLSPAIGKVVRDNLVLGIDVSYTNSKTTYTGTADNNANGFGAGFFVRKYRPLGNGFYLFGQSRLGFAYTHSSQTEPPGNNITRDVVNTYAVNLQFFPGIAYSLNPKWQLEAGLPNFFAVGYAHTKETQSYPGQSADFHNEGHVFSIQSAITGSNSLTIGVRYFIGG